MVLPSLTDALIVIILLIPGFIANLLFRKFGVYGRPVSEFETTIRSFVFSAIILFFFTLLTHLSDIDKIREQFFYPTNFTTLFAITIAVGLFAGALARAFRRDRTIGDSWAYTISKHSKIAKTFENLTKTGKKKPFKRLTEIEEEKRSEELELTVITKDNQEYTGFLVQASLDARGGILLRQTTKISRKIVNDETRTDQIKSGETMLFKGDDISRIIFNWDIQEEDSTYWIVKLFKKISGSLKIRPKRKEN